MDLPIDHFRLLGVSPTADAASILHRLQSRCDSPPDQGFTHEALLKRNDLLHRSADLLTDQKARSEYESTLLRSSKSHPNEAVGLNLPASSEVAGLILLWEAHGALEAFQIASHGLQLQPSRVPILDSGRQTDLTLVAALACRDAALEEQGKRRYEAAAQLLLDGIQLQQRMGKLPEQQRVLERELEALLPFRILDLISRNLSDRASHQQGLTLLDQLVSRRGGLNAKGKPSATDGSDSGELMTQEDFESFFQQVRRFLTVQEQIDLFGRWSERGEIEAGFLTVLALTAAGFSCRKPERLEQARELLQLFPASALDPMPLLGCLELLLGNVRKADHHFAATCAPDIQAWLAKHANDSLAAQCEYCRTWLKCDVLPGYRDVDVTAVDLDAWFADRDVKDYVDRLDQQSSRQLIFDTSFLPCKAKTDLDPTASKVNSEFSPNAVELETPVLSLLRWSPFLRSLLMKGATLVVAIAAISGALALMSGKRFGVPRSASLVKNKSTLLDPEYGLNQRRVELRPGQPAVTAPLVVLPLTSDTPSERQLRGLIQRWLNAKAEFLSGKNADVAAVARDRLVQLVQAERMSDAAASHSKMINASVTTFDVVSRTARRIKLKAQVAYSDKTIDNLGKIVNQTPARTLAITYVLGRDDGQWKLYEYIPDT
ncbi:IMS domain-containing protein [Synechococcus sp. M16CYN]|uniref:IMS domain-containing protein n=1 Tax=Synechococcus sp. M16CYN TaxID=3103139 RepID=UPI00334086B2